MDQDQQDQNSGAGNIDLNKILLPKKDAPSVDSAQRVDAGALYSQEHTAELPKVQREPAQNFSSGSIEPGQSSASASATSVTPLQTFQGDIARAVKTNNVSVVSIAAAEATRRGESPLNPTGEEASRDWKSVARTGVFILLGIVLLGGAGGLLGYALLHNAPLPAQSRGVAPYIAIDNTEAVTLSQDAGHTSAMQALVKAKDATNLSLGLVAQLYIQNPATSSSSGPSYMEAQALFGAIAPDMPETLLRDIEPVYLLGVHSFGINQPFLILKIDSYEQGYAGMLAWEANMKQDLYPLFAYTPAPKIEVVTQPTQNVSGDTASSTSTSTPSAVEPVFIQTGFVDRIVQNHDARVLLTPDNQIYLLWTFLDRSTLVITTNEGTLHEVIARLTQAPLNSLPNAQ